MRRSTRKAVLLLTWLGAGLLGVGIGVALCADRDTSSIWRDEHVLNDLTALQTSLDWHRVRHGSWPTRLDELVAGGELRSVPGDPWGQAYVYVPCVAQGEVVHYTLLSLGGGDPNHVRLIRSEDSALEEPTTAAPPAPAPPVSPRTWPLPASPRTPSDLWSLVPPLLTTAIAASLGLGVWFASRVRSIRHGRGHAEMLLRALQAVRRGPAVALRPRQGALHCAWCHASDQDRDALRACPGCAAALHHECWGLAGRCPTLGCPLPRSMPRSRGEQELARAAPSHPPPGAATMRPAAPGDPT